MLARKPTQAEEKMEVRSKIEAMEELYPSGLRDWAAIRAHLKRHDAAMIKDYEDDINTMLVFAGLFSAVVTAFIILSLTWLQQDNGQISTRLLAQISSQLAGGTADESLIALGAGRVEFKATIPTIWINILWALSLLFSLTAALGGIIIKQWLREYLLWDSVLSHSREAVLLRHIRYDAWEQWKVPEIISAIPAMLELALVLFLCGAVVLLWTLNIAVAIVVTVFGAMFCVLAVAAQVLPMFFHRCPYKSAVGWMGVTLWALLRHWARHAHARLRRARKRYSVRRSPDLEDGVGIRGFAHNDARPAHHRPANQVRTSSWRQRDLQRHRQWGMVIDWDALPEMEKKARLEMVELVILFHALAWVCTRTQDDRLLDKVNQCTRNFHNGQPKHLCLTAGMYAASQILSLNPRTLFTTLETDIKHEVVDGLEYGLYHLVAYPSASKERAIWQNRALDLRSFDMICNVLMNVARSFIRDMFPTGPTPRYPDSEHIRVLVEALFFLTHAVRESAPEWQDQFISLLCDLYNRLTVAEVADPWLLPVRPPAGAPGGMSTGPQYPGLKAPILHLLARICAVELTVTGEVQATPDDLSQVDYPQLAIQVFQCNPGYVRSEDRHVFVEMADVAIRSSVHGEDLVVTPASIKDLFEAITEAALTSLEKRVHNLGYRGEGLPLLQSLKWFAERRNRLNIHLITDELIDALDESIEANLVTAPDAVSILQALRQLSTKRGSAHIRWESSQTAADVDNEPEPNVALPGGIGVASTSGAERIMVRRDYAHDQAHGTIRMPVPVIPSAAPSIVTEEEEKFELTTITNGYPSPQSEGGHSAGPY